MLRASAAVLAFLTGCLSPAAAADSTKPMTSLLVGVWSFDQSCASGDGMGLKPDGQAWFDEYSSGMWAEAEGGKRLVMILQAMDPVDNSPGAVVLKEMQIESLSATHLEGTFSDGRRVDALRCPQE